MAGGNHEPLPVGVLHRVARGTTAPRALDARTAREGWHSVQPGLFEFAPAAEAVLRPLVEGGTVDLATLADAAGLDVEDVAGLVQELVAEQAATVGSLL